ncbi:MULTISPECIES: zinc ribbon domain-containing protein [Weeksella]|uniref:zinc ribbon domain-containing protein n=1 Tax=Weeksella TaxID=1013 RepID=UPI0008BAC28E|nr:MULTISPECIES: zinc ribbon domain-containing protein [Weeksella]MDK7374813.1 zinc ribbon domain-containing protein [Weeksella virosa]MDK7674856.1 zinc ribbon domain-containing protein [Weeksella virosa]OFM85053.1 hypothetical protein HMPREF2660_07980 [Weeksella sp. HMSC059D05]SUP53185.1 TM2 domain [Weeksella virosa]
METENQKICPYCAELINADAIKCKHCGEFLDNNLRESRKATTQVVMPEQPIRKWNPGVAALLSLLIPGAGQMYKGKIGSGILWLLLVLIGYSIFIVPGIILHLICIFSASSGNPYKD